MSERGRWILEYETFNSSDMSNPSGKVTQRVELGSKTRWGAIRKGKKLWNERASKGAFQGWDRITYPHTPRVIREIPIK